MGVSVMDARTVAEWQEVRRRVLGATVYDVTWYGATGDGTTDDTVAIAAAKAAAGSSGVLWFPTCTGSYRTAPLLYTTLAKLAGAPGVRIKLNTAGTATAVVTFDFTGGGSFFNYGAAMDDLILDGNGLVADGLLLKNVISSHFHNIRATNVTVAGFHLAWAQLCTFVNPICSRNVEAFTTTPTTGLLVDGAGASSANTFTNPTFEHVSGSGIKGLSLINSLFLNGTSEGNAIGIEFGEAVATAGTVAGTNTVVMMDLEANSVADLVIRATGTDNTFIGLGAGYTSGVPVVGTGTVSAAAGTLTFSTSQASTVHVGSVITVAGTAYTVLTFNGTTSATVTGTPTFAASAFTITDAACQILGGKRNSWFGGTQGGFYFDALSSNNHVNDVKLYGVGRTIADAGTTNTRRGVFNLSDNARVTDTQIRARGNHVPLNGGTVTIDIASTSYAVITAVAAVASLTVAAPINAVDGAELDVTIHNASGGALAVTWDAIVHHTGIVIPATGFTRSYAFRYDTNYAAWYLVSMSAVDQPA